MFSKEVLFEIIYYVAGLYSFHWNNHCLPYLLNTIFSYPEIKGSVYPLMNFTGEFSCIPWLYAHFEGVDIVGVPAGTCSFDGNISDPLAFMDHDMFHNSSIYMNMAKTHS